MDKIIIKHGDTVRTFVSSEMAFQYVCALDKKEIKYTVTNIKDQLRKGPHRAPRVEPVYRDTVPCCEDGCPNDALPNKRACARHSKSRS